VRFFVRLEGRAQGGGAIEIELKRVASSDVPLRDNASALTDRRSDEMSLDEVERISI
jgi:hypothetical protein